MSRSKYETAIDGHPARVSGPWVRRKHHFLRRYCDMVARGPGKKQETVFLDVMSGCGRCIIDPTKEEVPGSPFVALDYPFSRFVFIEQDERLHEALRHRVGAHPKAGLCKVINASWIDLAEGGLIRFSKELTVAFVDPTGISQVPWSAVKALLTGSKRIDMLLTIQHAMGITLNARHYLASEADETAMTRFLDGRDFKDWDVRDPSDFGDRAMDAFARKVYGLGFRVTRHVSVPKEDPLYRLAHFSRHPLGEKFWQEALRCDETGQRELL